MSRKNPEITMALIDGSQIELMATVGVSLDDLGDFLADGRQQTEPTPPTVGSAFGSALDNRRSA